MIRVCEPTIGALEKRYVLEALDQNWLSSTAPPVARFEAAFAGRFGVKHAVAVNSGGSALFLALWALGIRAGDEVIVPTFTMIATAAAVTQCGATPVFVDCRQGTFTIDPGGIEAKITTRTRAIVPVHVYGHACPMDTIVQIARAHDLRVVEDCAEAHGATYQGQALGTFGDAACFSFYANKLLTTGEGGMVITDSDALDHELRRLRAYDFDDTRHFWHARLAWNLRMSALEAAVGLAQLERLDELIAMRRRNARYYTAGLEGVADVILFEEAPGETCVFWMYPILARARDRLMAFLEAKGIETRTFFVPMHRQPMYREESAPYPVADALARNGLYLPSAGHLGDGDKDYVMATVKEFYARPHPSTARQPG